MRHLVLLLWLSIMTPSMATDPPFAGDVQDALLENSLGMKFVGVSGTRVKFCIWETRVMDYEVFLEATDRPKIEPDFEQTSTHPVVNVTWDEAAAFCDWLTKRERQDGKIASRQRYRLPKDEEWTIAAGFPAGEGKTPEMRLKSSIIWPWGYYWPPLAADGNFGSELKVDSYEWSSPVASFKPNRLGLYDMGGNVWEWCEDWYNEATVTKTLRGGSFNDSLPQYLLVSYRFSATMNLSNEDIGFRVVFDPGE